MTGILTILQAHLSGLGLFALDQECHISHTLGVFKDGMALTAKVRKPNRNVNIGIQEPSLRASPYTLGWVELDSWSMRRVCDQIQR